MGIRLSLPKFFEVTFIPGADSLRLYSFLSTNLITSLTVFLSCPWLIISLILLSFSTYAFRIESNFEYSDYQKSERDFAFVVDKNIKVQDLINIITATDKELIKSVKVFDVYEGENIPLEKKSIALNVTIQSSKKTLNDSDLESINNLIIKTVENKTGAKIRS